MNSNAQRTTKRNKLVLDQLMKMHKSGKLATAAKAYGGPPPDRRRGQSFRSGKRWYSDPNQGYGSGPADSDRIFGTNPYKPSKRKLS